MSQETNTSTPSAIITNVPAKMRCPIKIRDIDQAVKVKGGTLLDLTQHIRDGWPANELIGKDHPVDSEFTADV